MYGKIFSQIFDGTLHGHWQALVTFEQFIILSDSDGVVDMTPAAISARTSIPLEIIEQGIAELEQPDPYSKSLASDGRRIELLSDHRPWGWRIVNHETYANLADYDEVKAQNRARSKEYRDRQRALRQCNGVTSPVTPHHHASRPSRDVTSLSRHADADADVREERKAVETSAKPAQSGETEDPASPSADVPRGTAVLSQGDASAEDWNHEHMASIKIAYPDRSGEQRWIRARRAIASRLAEGHMWAELIAGASRYAAYCTSKGIVGTEQVKEACHFFGTDRSFLLPWTATAADNGKSERERLEQARFEVLEQRAKATGFRGPDPRFETPDSFETKLRLHERETVPQRPGATLAELLARAKP